MHTAAWLLPGTALVFCVWFINRYYWAVLLTIGILGLSVFVAVGLWVRMLLAVRAVPLKVAVFTAIVALWLFVLGSSLTRLRQQ